MSMTEQNQPRTQGLKGGQALALRRDAQRRAARKAMGNTSRS